MTTILCNSYPVDILRSSRLSLLTIRTITAAIIQFNSGLRDWAISPARPLRHFALIWLSSRRRSFLCRDAGRLHHNTQRPEWVMTANSAVMELLRRTIDEKTAVCGRWLAPPHSVYDLLGREQNLEGTIRKALSSITCLGGERQRGGVWPTYVS